MTSEERDLNTLRTQTISVSAGETFQDEGKTNAKGLKSRCGPRKLEKEQSPGKEDREGRSWDGMEQPQNSQETGVPQDEAEQTGRNRALLLDHGKEAGLVIPSVIRSHVSVSSFPTAPG